MHKFYKYLAFAPVLLLGATALSGCEKQTDTNVLRILNCEDYIYEYEDGDEENAKDLEGMSDSELLKYKNAYRMDMVDQFVEHWASTHEGQKIEIVYDTFDTNETMFNELKTGKTTYDVIVPSDYMIQKLLSNNMLEKFDDTVIDDLWENISPFLKGKFESIKSQNEESIYYYSVPYMWGTVGMMYNPNFYDLDDEVVHDLFLDWDSLYGEELAGSFSIKDSVRDTYAVSLIHAYRDEIALANDNDSIKDIFNRHDKKAMADVKNDMLKLKSNAFGFECDSGKTDMTTQKIGANMCWSGDATWAITEARENDLELYYSIPTNYNGENNKGASNVWFDGFCMPKTEGLHKELAQEFIKFMSQPENAVQNCYCVGYTPGVAGEEMLQYMYECYDVRGEIGGDLNVDSYYIKYDLSYFFNDPDEIIPDEDNDAILFADPDFVGRELTAQYPSSEIFERLAIMEDFGDEGNNRLLDMWEQVRTNPLPTWGIVLFAIEGVLAISLFIYFINHNVYRKRFKRERALK